MLVKKGERMPIGIYSLAGRMGRGHLPGRRGAGDEAAVGRVCRGSRVPSGRMTRMAQRGVVRVPIIPRAALAAQ